MHCMKLTIGLLVFLIAGSLAAQESSKPALLSEYSVFGNYSLPVSNGYPVEAKPGFGVAVYSLLRPGKKVIPVIGVEFVRTNFYVSTVASGDLSYFGNPAFYTDVDFYYNQLRLSFSTRCHFGKTSTFFLEPGAYLNMPFADYMKGTLHKSVNGKEETERGKTDLVTSPGIGLSLGLGFQKPIKKGALLFRLDENIGSGRTLMDSGTPNESSIFYNHYLRFSIIYLLPVKQL
jgi:hypothetical protein